MNKPSFNHLSRSTGLQYYSIRLERRPAGSTVPPSAHGRLMLTVLVGLAEFERGSALASEGRERAKARGVKMGRPPKLTPRQVKEAIRRRDAGKPMRNIVRTYNVSHSTISRLTT